MYFNNIIYLYRQLVLLGAGLDTRAWRLNLPQLKIFEVDIQKVIDVKRTIMHNVGCQLSKVMHFDDLLVGLLMFLVMLKSRYHNVSKVCNTLKIWIFKSINDQCSLKRVFFYVDDEFIDNTQSLFKIHTLRYSRY